ncbi:pyridoxal phosphate-dependent aminotransferase [Streptomyces hainanensis]|uniref:Aminotransferase n=1 Tax=Streptomyces hainanensis TaxID=402648 RepID=A0A4R4TC35_9ACTN|nr:aminotransferase class I/II-fold pyridoxal phosphate-dependent enzyme [Streptomyces hainanensis]TDC72373.1 aminotransferase class I/II-fold pyridoxal phosphate-dependent enzyme [Streptomyces hainanensis]
MPQIASTVRAIPASGIRRIFELAAELDDVIQLSIGEPELPVAPHIREAGARAWRDDVTNYTPNSGIPPLRSAIVGKLARDNGYSVGDDQVHVTAGGAQALHLAMSFTLAPGDEILIPDPGYATFAMTPRLLGAVPVPYRLRAEHGFTPDLAALASLVTPRTRVLLVNSPSNPLGVVFDRATVGALVDFAARHDLWIISDEVYEYLTFDAGCTSLAAVDTEDRVFGVYSLSKTYALTGARVGYLVTPPGLTERFRAAQESTVSCVNAPAQSAALAALEGDQDGVTAARAHYRANLAAAGAVLDGRGIRYQRPGGAFYLWIDVSHASGGDVAAWAEHFLRTERVAVAPGTAFGAAGEGWVRICFAGGRAPLVEALGRFPVPGAC